MDSHMIICCCVILNLKKKIADNNILFNSPGNISILHLHCLFSGLDQLLIFSISISGSQKFLSPPPLLILTLDYFLFHVPSTEISPEDTDKGIRAGNCFFRSLSIPTCGEIISAWPFLTITPQPLEFRGENSLILLSSQISEKMNCASA